MENKFKNEKYVALKKQDVEALGLYKILAGSIISNLVSQSYWATKKDFSYLTNRQVEFDVIEKLRPVSKRLKHGMTSQDVLSHSLPFVANVPIERLVRLREAEPEAFSVYRDTLAKLLNKAQKLSAEKRREIFFDVVQPEINKIDFAMKRSRKMLLRSLTQDLVLGVGSIAVGLFSGLMPGTVGNAVAGLGGAHYSGQFIKNFAKLFTEPEEAMRNSYYFLWKAGRSSGQLSSWRLP